MFVFTQIASDNFIRANENPLSGGGKWLTSPTGQPLKIVSDLVESNQGADVFCFQPYSGGLTWPNDQYSEITVTACANVNDFVGPLIRTSTSPGLRTFYVATLQGGLGSSVSLFIQYGDGSNIHTLVGPLSVVLNSGDRLRLGAVGTTISAYINGTLVPGSIISDSHIASGLPGIVSLADAVANVQVGGWSGGITASPYSVPDCRNYGNFPNSSRDVQDTLIYDVQTSSNSAVPGTDSRAAGAPVDDRVAAIIPLNSRTPGTFGPGE